MYIFASSNPTFPLLPIDRKHAKKIGSRQHDREASASFGKQRDHHVADSAAYNDSEGEAGDHSKFAERANGKLINDQIKPLPHFERSVFDKYMEHHGKQNAQNVWNKTSIEPQSDNSKINLGNERKRAVDEPGKSQKSRHKAEKAGGGAEEQYGCVVKGSNKHQIVEYPEGWPLAHPQNTHLRNVHPQRITTKF